MRIRPWVFVAVVVAMVQHAKFSHGGSCWLNINKNGKCSLLVSTGGSKEECCSSGPLGSSVAAAWSDEDLTPSSIFYMHIQGGVKCTKCKETCEGVQCPHNKKCAMRRGQPKCVCAPNCEGFRLQHRLTGGVHGRGGGPVCGTDGQTYKSVCRMLKRSCRRRLQISVAYEGPCKSSCSQLNCPPLKQCLLDQNLMPHCVNCAPRHCGTGVKVLAGEKAVCGVDGVTYLSVCHLHEAACLKGSAIPVAYRGTCDQFATCDSVRCSVGQKCLTSANAGAPRCVTCSRPRWCRLQRRNAISGPICGSNDQTYTTWCDMMDDACSSGTALDTKHSGACHTRSRDGGA